MNTKEEIKQYWNDWITKWYLECVKSNETPDKIKEWDVPKDRLGNEEKAFRYFPEPYWGKINEELKGIFLNINPGTGGKEQLYGNSQIKNE